MGDFKKSMNVADMDERESRGSQHRSVKSIVSGPKSTGAQKKDKVISAKVYPDMWNKFSKINKSQGMTNSSVLNKLIAEYVRDNAQWLNVV